MKRILFSVLFLSCGAVHAGEAAAPAAPAAETTAAQQPPPDKYAPEIRQAMRNLSALLERLAEIPPSRLEAFAPGLAAFDGKVKDALGKELVAELARKEKEEGDKERSASAKSTLRAFRAALQLYYGDKGGAYPKNPELLVPALLPAVPELHLPDHEKTAKIKIIDSKKYDKDFSRAVGDSGGWLYFSNPGSGNYGLLLLDCSHTEAGGQEFSRY